MPTSVRATMADLPYWLVVLFGLSLIISSGPAYTLSLPPLPGPLAWKNLVPADLVFLLLLGTCILTARQSLLFRRRADWLPAAVLWSSLALTVVVSPRPGAGVPDLARFAYSLTLFLLVVGLRISPERLRVLAIAYTLGTFTVCALTLGAYVRYRLAGVESSLLWLNTEPGWSLGSSARAIGPFAHPTTFVIFLHSALFYLIVMMRSEPRRPSVRALGWATTILVFAVLPLTYSRAAVAIFVTLFIVSWRSPHTSKLGLVRTLIAGHALSVSVVLATVVTTWASFPFQIHLDPETKFLNIRFYAAKEERHLLYGAALRMFTDSPLVGVGPGLFEENVKRYVPYTEYRDALKFYYHEEGSLVRRYQTGPDPHSSWFGWLARSGMVGFAGMATFVGWVVLRLRRTARSGSMNAPTAELALAFMCGFLVLGLLNEILLLKLFWLFMGLSLAASDSNPH